MAEFCVDCWNKINETEHSAHRFILSQDEELCEECGRFKRVIVAIKKRYIIQEWFSEWLSRKQ